MCRECMQAYLAQAEEHADSMKRYNSQFRQLSPNGHRPPIFLSTEDPATVDFFARQPLWEVSYTEVPRKPDASVSTLAYVAQIGGYEEMMNSLVNLGEHQYVRNANKPDVHEAHPKTYAQLGPMALHMQHRPS